jgi:membrane fusion protein (multidrug efflux system)
MNAESDPKTAAAAARRGANRSRGRALLVLLAVVVLGGAVYGYWWKHTAQYEQTTDDAYVSGNVVTLTPEVAGTVIGIQADDTDLVRAGTPVVALDQADLKVALSQAEADLAKTVRDVRALYASTDQLKATLEAREADLARARDDLKRREDLASSGAVSGEELQHARSTVTASIASVAAARESWAANRAQTEGTRIASHPLVLAAAGRVRSAYLGLHRATLIAPVTGYVAKRSVQVGERVAPGAALLAIVPLDQIWVDANLKEDQLRNVRIGQPVELESDLYGSSVKFDGRVVGLGAGTGSVFSALPSQNATGNWIKVVQRLPVRVALDPAQLRAHPLRIGLSMRVTVSTRDRSGASLALAPQTTCLPRLMRASHGSWAPIPGPLHPTRRGRRRERGCGKRGGCAGTAAAAARACARADDVRLVVCDLHGGPRHHDRQRLAADDRG